MRHTIAADSHLLVYKNVYKVRASSYYSSTDRRVRAARQPVAGCHAARTRRSLSVSAELTRRHFILQVLPFLTRNSTGIKTLYRESTKSVKIEVIWLDWFV